MISYPVVSNTILSRPVGYTNHTSLFEKAEHASDSDKNAGQNGSVPYLAELRGVGASGQPEKSGRQDRNPEDPLGRGVVLDFKA